VFTAALVMVLASAGLALGAAVISAPDAGALPYTEGNLFLSIGNGQVQERTPAGALVQTLTSPLGSTFNTGSAFDKNGNFYVTEFSAANVSQFDDGGTFTGAFGSGYNASPESIVFDAAGNVYVGQADGTADILKFSAAGAPLDSFDVATEDRGSDWIDLEADGCTMRYTSEGSSVKRYDVCTDTQLTDFATGLTRPVFAHRVLPDGGSLVAATSQVVRLDSSGAVVDTYTPADPVGTLFALNLDPDGTSFWTADLNNGNVFHFDIASGAELGGFAAGTPVYGLSLLGERTAVPSIELTPASATNPTGTDHTLTATATDGGAPAAGESVTFTVVSGPNTGTSGTSTTNGSGVATFSYSSSATGTDTIRASFVAESGATVTSNDATKTWTGGQDGEVVVRRNGKPHCADNRAAVRTRIVVKPRDTTSVVSVSDPVMALTRITKTPNAWVLHLKSTTGNSIPAHNATVVVDTTTGERTFTVGIPAFTCR
jgi:hypothetical protein